MVVSVVSIQTRGLRMGYRSTRLGDLGGLRLKTLTYPPSLCVLKPYIPPPPNPRISTGCCSCMKYA